ncbi:MAG: metal ABC transporter solute-binding protein, Zn/Mn family [Wolinella sp.]
MKKIVVLLLFAGFLFGAQKPMVFVSIDAQKYWVKKIMGSDARIESFISSGANAHTYEPKPSMMKKLADATIIFGIGIEFEEVWFSKFQQLYPKLKIVSLDENMKKIEATPHEHHHHEPGEECPLEHGGLDPHVWLSVINAKIASLQILETLKKLDSANSAEYQQNYDHFIVELDSLHSEIIETLKNAKGAEFMVFHPTWGYFARDYELVQKSIEIEGKEPKPAQLAALIKEAKEHGAKTIFVQKGFSKKAAEQIAKEIGARVLETDPLSSDWANGMRSFAVAISGK